MIYEEEITPEAPVVEPVEAEETVVEQSAQEIQPPKDNLVTIPADKLADYKRKMTGSRDEAMRLKAETERLKAENEALKSPQNNIYSDQDVEHLRNLAKRAGLSFREDQEQFQQRSYDEEKQEAVKVFLDKYPEYARIGDVNSDELWETLESNVKNYVNPPRGRDFLAILEREHKLLHFNPEIERERGKALGMAQAKVQDQTTIGGGGSGKSQAPTKKVPQQKQAVMDGFASVRPQAFNS